MIDKKGRLTGRTDEEKVLQGHVCKWARLKKEKMEKVQKVKGRDKEDEGAKAKEGT